MGELIDAFGLQKGDCVSLVGSGGKTTLMYTLAKTAPMASVLMSTTTKIGMPPTWAYDRFLDDDGLQNALPVSGRTLAARQSDTGKLSAPSDMLLQKAHTQYGLSLLECDGSRNLPLKGWAEWEPVVPVHTSITIGIIPLWPLGAPAEDRLIHRFPLFCALTGIRAGQPIEAEHLVQAICSKRGKSLFTKAKGRKFLFFSQVETPKSLHQAQCLARQLPTDFQKSLHGIVAGSAKENHAQLL